MLNTDFLQLLCFVIGGGTGFIGRHVSSHLENLGHKVMCISRTEGPGLITWVGRLANNTTNVQLFINFIYQLIAKFNHKLQFIVILFFVTIMIKLVICISYFSSYSVLYYTFQ